MSHFKEIIEKIEAHTGAKFDYSKKRHRFHLQEEINRQLTEADRIKTHIGLVMSGHHVYNPATHKPHKHRS